jgi:superfamily II DNA or RNA helicase
VDYQIDDQRRTLPAVDYDFHGQLKPFQAPAVVSMLKKDFGTLSAPTGSGKTVMALNIISRRRQPTLIVVHTKELANQWDVRVETFLGIPKKDIGRIGGGKKRIGEKITVALVQSLYKCAHKVSSHIGFLVVDECHRAPSRTFTEAVSAFDSKYMLGLSATPFRRDRLSRLIFWYLGDRHHEVDKNSLEEQGHVLKADVITRETDFISYSDPSTQYSQMLKELTENKTRNFLIATDVAGEVKNGDGICLVLSDRKNHCKLLQQQLKEYFLVESEVLTGDVPAKHRKSIVDRLNHGEILVLIATGQLVGEGFDCPDLSTLFLATPIRFSGRVIQYLGRILRPAPGKDRATVYDYVDVNVGPLAHAAKTRRRVYKNAA